MPGGGRICPPEQEVTSRENPTLLRSQGRPLAGVLSSAGITQRTEGCKNELAFICFAFRNYIASSTLNLIVSTPLRSAPSANCRALCAREKSQSPSDLIIRLVKRLPSKLSSSSVRSAR